MRSSAQREVAQGERIAINTPVQGTAADVLKMAMVALQKRLDEEQPNSHMLLTVHDELVLEVPEEDLSSVLALTREVMEGAVQLRVPLVVDVGHGHHWGEAH